MTDNTATKRTRTHTNSNIKGPDNDMSVADLAKLLQTQLAENQRSAKNDLEKLREALTTSFAARIDSLEHDIKADITKLREDNFSTFGEIRATIDKTVSDTTQAFDRASRSNDLIVSGVPYISGEDLRSYFSSWCLALGYVNNNIPLVDMRRLVKGPATDGTVYIILIEFAITMQRREFYSRYMKSRSLSLAHIGFSADKRIFINENIGPAARTIRTKALSLKKSGQLCSVFTKDGIVYVRKSTNDRDAAVMSEEDLNLIIQPK